MKLKDLEEMINQQEATVDSRYVGAALPALLRKTYLWMTFALIITGIVAYGMTTVTFTTLDGTTLPIAFKIFENKATFWILFIAELAMVFILSARIMRLSLTSATLLFIAYSALNGVMLSSVFLIYTMESIANAFFVTAATFGVMSLYGYFTKTSLDGLGKYLGMALIGLIIALVVNLFMKSGTFNLIISCVAVILFTILTAYDTQKIKLMLALQPDAGEGAQRIALLGALSLYLDFINLFIYILQFFGSRNN
jgi:FtsH-binding integral membrane protein